MAADLHIHVILNEPVTAEAHFYYPTAKSWMVTRVVTEKELASFFGGSMGSRWFRGFHSVEEETIFDREAWALVTSTPNVWVGEVSWLKAALFEDEEKYVPGPVAKVFDIIDEHLPMIDDALIEQIREALRVENTTSYSVNSEVTNNEVINFLQKHKGLRCFTINW